jgi:hypothetical protein
VPAWPAEPGVPAANVPPLPPLLVQGAVVVVLAAVVVVVAPPLAVVVVVVGAPGFAVVVVVLPALGLGAVDPHDVEDASATVLVVPPDAPAACTAVPDAEPRARAAWLPSRRDPQAEAKNATVTTESATAMCRRRWRDHRPGRGASARSRLTRRTRRGRTARTNPTARTAGSRPGCAECARAGRRSGRWPTRCAGPLPPGACSRRSARRHHHR